MYIDMYMLCTLTFKHLKFNMDMTINKVMNMAMDMEMIIDIDM